MWKSWRPSPLHLGVRQHQGPERAVEVLPKEEGECVMYGLSKTRKYVPKVYRGPPKPMQKDVFIDGNITALQLLQKACPEFAYGDDPHVCCSTDHLIVTQEQFDIIDALGFSRCPSCFHNIRQLLCFLLSPAK
ncbi:hypothetical protein AVEN_39866-1 [Araneus ventricosus]|uniref:Niemann-Pick C1 N-terminal domain-containing protein n=1 Tax=Araneus ventricosus TaxID=182803 RepID=A0A4Y2NK01_ARAVE|nr:hypothetical protein AVEN_39866-1 [Araneus ventricosus]